MKGKVEKCYFCRETVIFKETVPDVPELASCQEESERIKSFWLKLLKLCGTLDYQEAHPCLQKDFVTCPHFDPVIYIYKYI